MAVEGGEGFREETRARKLESRRLEWTLHVISDQQGLTS